MKNTKKRLSVKKNTLRNISSEEVGLARGGATTLCVGGTKGYSEQVGCVGGTTGYSDDGNDCFKITIKG